MRASVLAQALVRWQHAAGPYWPYVCAAPFQRTPEAEALAQQWQNNDRVARRPRRTPRSAGSEMLLPLFRSGESGPGDEGRPESEGAPDLVLLDLPAERLLAAAPDLATRGWYVVPVVQRWIASPAVLPCRRLLGKLIVGAWQTRRPASPRGAILIADGERTGQVGYPATVTGRAFDNRYEYQICRFPAMDFLKAQGVRQVQWLTNGTRPAERPVRPDLAPYLEALLRAGLTVDVQQWPD